MLDGFYTNLAIFPAVPVKNTGLRLTFTLHTDKSDIKNLMDAVEYHLPKALAEEGRTMEDVYKAFKLEGEPVSAKPSYLSSSPRNSAAEDLKVAVFHSIGDVNRQEWDAHFAGKGSFDWNGLKLLEDTFQKNPEQENNWQIRYYRITDSQGKIVLMTFFTLALTKEDMLAAARISAAIEEQRKTEPYYLCSMYYGMGTPLTEGQHLFIDRTHPQWKRAVVALLEQANKDRMDLGGKALVLRDFLKTDTVLKDLFIKEGFFPYDMPDNHVLDISQWTTPEEYYAQLSWSKKKHVRYNVLRHADKFSVEIWNHPPTEKLPVLYKMYKSLKGRKYELNTFDLPYYFFEKLAQSENWEIIVLKARPEAASSDYDGIAAFCICYRNSTAYCPMLIGNDPALIKKTEPYRNILYQTIVRGKQLGCEKVLLAFTASVEKRHFGAEAIPTTMFVDNEDNFAMSKMSVM